MNYSEDDKNDVYVGQNDSEKELSEKTSELTKNKNKVLVNNLKLVNHNRIDDFFIINESKEIYNVKVKIVEENLDFIGIKMLPILEGKQVITSYRNQTK